MFARYLAKIATQGMIIMLCVFYVIVAASPSVTYAQSKTTSIYHNTLTEAYGLISRTSFQYTDDEIDQFGARALHLKGDARLYALWRVLYAYKDDQNREKFDAWHNRIQAQAQDDGDANLDVLTHFMYQAYQNESNGFTELSERDWAAYMAMSDPAIQNIVSLERIRQLQHFAQWADAIDMGDKLIIRLNAVGNDAVALLNAAHQTTIYALLAVGDNDAYAKHMLAIAHLLRDGSFFSQKMDVLYNMSLWAAKENDLDVAEKFQNLYNYYVKNYNIEYLNTWNELLCVTISDRAQNYENVVKCLSNSNIMKGDVRNFADYSKLQYLVKAYAQLGELGNLKIYKAKLNDASKILNIQNSFYDAGIRPYILKAEGKDAAAFDALTIWTRDRIQYDEEARIQSVRSMYQALRQELDSKTAESRLLVKQVQMSRMLLAAAIAIAVMFAVIVLGGFLWVIRMRRMQSRLTEATVHAEAANVAKSRFLAVMSHELRTPLNGVLGMAQALRNEDLNPDQREQVNILVDSGQTLMVLLNDVLDMSRIEAGRIELAPTNSNMRDMLERVIHTYSTLIADKPVSLSYEIKASAIMPLSFDILRVYQCLSNLVSNALKFTDKGDVRLVVSAEPREGGRLVRVEVHDTGIGMSATTLEKLFETYSQADAATARTYGGSGLGLNISRRLAELMGGGLTVSSEAGAGSVFVMTFFAGNAVVDSPPLIAPMSESVGENEVRNVNILLVDDHPVNRKVARLFLEPYGYMITEAVDGQEALDADMSRFDLVLMDVNMPRLNGLDATRQYRETEAPGRHLPIVALTADAMQDQIEACYAAGMDAHIAKPILMDTLVDTVARLLADSETGDMSAPPLAGGGAL